MKKNILPVIALGLSAVLFSCNNEAAKPEGAVAAANNFSLDSVRAAIAVSNSTFGSGFATGDSANFVSHYTSDACISPSNMPQICGTAGLTAYF
ncbi:MAG: hypothetical protein WCI49_09710, partial [Ferruginibacter sp.]